MDLPDNRAHVSTNAHPSNDIVRLSTGTGFDILTELFEHTVLVFHLVQTALEDLRNCLGRCKRLMGAFRAVSEASYAYRSVSRALK